MPLKAGLRQVVATVLKSDGVKPEGLGPARIPIWNREGDVPSAPLVDFVAAGWRAVQRPGAARIRRAAAASSCASPAGQRATRTACATKILSTLARRAYRRPATNDDVQTLLGFYKSARADGDFDTGIRAALERLLVSPDFLFRIEADPAKVAPGTAYRLSDVELASRLSFFLWSSIPDDELLDLAIAGKLREASGPRSAGAAHARRPARARRAGRQLLRPVAADAQRLAADAGREPEVSLVRRQPAGGLRQGDGAVPRRSAEGGPQHRGAADGERHVPERAAGAALRHSRRVRQPLPPGDARRREPLGPAGQGQRAGGDVVPDPHLADHPRQVAAREHPGCAGAAASART